MLSFVVADEPVFTASSGWRLRAQFALKTQASSSVVCR